MILGESDLEPLRTANYTTLRRTKNTVILTRLERDFGTYFVEVVVGLQGNANEDADAILHQLGNDHLDEILAATGQRGRRDVEPIARLCLEPLLHGIGDVVGRADPRRAGEAGAEVQLADRRLLRFNRSTSRALTLRSS